MYEQNDVLSLEQEAEITALAQISIKYLCKQECNKI